MQFYFRSAWLLLSVAILNVAYLRSLQAAQDTDYHEWLAFEKQVNSFLERLIIDNKALLQNITDDSQLSDDCRHGISDFVNKLHNQVLDSVSMLDSSGALMRSFTEGSLTSLGNHYRCTRLPNASYCLVRSRVRLPRHRNPNHFGKLGLPTLENQFTTRLRKIGYLLSHYNITTGVCVPRQCDTKDVHRLADYYTAHVGLSALQNEVEYCDYYKPAKLTASFVLPLTFFAIVILLNIIGSKTADTNSIWSNFNFRRNVNKLLHAPASAHSVSSIDGIKGLLVIVVLMTHYDFNIFETQNLFKLNRMTASSILPVPVLYTVSHFFFFSGIFAYRVKGSPILLLMRHLRYVLIATISTLFALLLQSDFVKNAIGGAYWSSRIVRSNHDGCFRNWHLSSLSIEHLLTDNSVTLCLFTAWFQNIDSVLHLLFSAIALSLGAKMTWSGRKFAAIAIMFIFSGSLILAGRIWQHDLPGTLVPSAFFDNDFFFFFSKIHASIYAGLSPFWLGALFGWFLDQNFKISKRVITIVSWAVFVLGYTLELWLQSTSNQLLNIAYGSVSRTLWPFWMATVIYSSMHGYLPQFVEKLLASSFLRLCCRMSTSVILIQYIITKIIYASYENPSTNNSVEMFFEFLTSSALIFILVIVLTAAIKMPFDGLLKRYILGVKSVDNNLNRALNDKKRNDTLIDNKCNDSNFNNLKTD